jgi:hypothetical protein
MLKQPELSAEHLYFEYPPKRPDDPFSEKASKANKARITTITEGCVRACSLRTHAQYVLHDEIFRLVRIGGSFAHR